MSEATWRIGVVTARNQKGTGIKIEGSEDWLNFTKYDEQKLDPYRPDQAMKGVRVKAYVEGSFIRSICAVAPGDGVNAPAPTTALPPAPPAPTLAEEAAPPPPPGPTPGTPPPAGEWVDPMTAASDLKLKGIAIEAAALIVSSFAQAGVMKDVPSADWVGRYAQSLINPAPKDVP